MPGRDDWPLPRWGKQPKTSTFAGGSPDRFAAWDTRTAGPLVVGTDRLGFPDAAAPARGAGFGEFGDLRAAEEQHVGGKFAGTISGVTSFGLFVELDDSKVNGLVHVTQLPNDFYHFDPIRKTLTGERRGREYRLGDRVEIVVLKASVEDRRIDFRLVDEPGVGGELPSQPRGQPAKRKKAKY